MLEEIKYILEQLGFINNECNDLGANFRYSVVGSEVEVFLTAKPSKSFISGSYCIWYE